MSSSASTSETKYGKAIPGSVNKVIYQAAFDGDLKLVKELLERKSDPGDANVALIGYLAGTPKKMDEVAKKKANEAVEWLLVEKGALPIFTINHHKLYQSQIRGFTYKKPIAMLKGPGEIGRNVLGTLGVAEALAGK